MKRRLDHPKLAPEAVASLRKIEEGLRASGLEPELIELVKLRVSEINGCAYCIDMHSKELLAAGVPAQRLFAVQVWREAPFFSERERAALEWAEALTRLGPEGISDALYARASASFSETELVSLSWAIATIGVWNRLAIAFRDEVGSYRVSRRSEAGQRQGWPRERREGPKVDGEAFSGITSTTEAQEILH